MNVLVTGGTGNVGGVVVKELLKRGAKDRVLARKQREEGKLAAGVEVAVGDLLDPVSLEQAMQGVDKLFLLNAIVADELTHALIEYGMARRAGRKHVTYLSVFKVDQFRDVPHFASKLAVENELREFGIAYTILRPGYYIQNDGMLRGALTGPGVYPMPIGTAGICAVIPSTSPKLRRFRLPRMGKMAKRTTWSVPPDQRSGQCGDMEQANGLWKA